VTLTRTCLAVCLTLSAPAAWADDLRLPRPTRSDLGKLPAGWRVAKTGPGEGSIWEVTADATAPSKAGVVLTQTAAGPKPLYNLCVADTPAPKDLELTVSFKALSGEIDQGGGLIWRYKDADNYYIARMNPLEDNFRVYTVVAGKRTQLATQEGLNVPAGEWHTITIRHVGKHITCSLDGVKHLDVTDGTFPGAGKVGLWTKADAKTSFDGLRVSPAVKVNP
jgi:hypothetical protein